MWTDSQRNQQMRVRPVRVAAINTLSICRETMRERDNGAGEHH